MGKKKHFSFIESFWELKECSDKETAEKLSKLFLKNKKNEKFTFNTLK